MSDPRPHLLFIASWYPYVSAPVQGIFIQRHAQTAALDYRVSVVFAYPDPNLTGNNILTGTEQHGNLTEIRVSYSPQTTSLPLLGKYRKSRRYINAIRAGVAEAIMRHGTPALLHLHVIWRGAVAALPLLRELRVPLVISEHWSGYMPEDGNYHGLLMRTYTERIVKRAQHITVVSEKMRQAMQSHSLNGNYSLLHNVTDTTLFKPAPVLLHEEPFQLLHVSSLTNREKNISGILRVMKTLRDEKITLRIIGNGPERAQHEHEAATLDVLGKNVFFEGPKTPAEVAEAMQHSHALLMFSHFEGMPCVIAEAQSCGLPVIATRTGGITQMVNEQQGILAQPGNETELRRAVLDMKQHYHRYNRASICEHAVATYSTEAVRRELHELYAKLLP
ncbi:MAG: glycosyltransferase [Bacteroidia bacterium]|jgi:glycosyltransferase involved in cell wall biosynthesis|nr:glycosyltransferase [Bacteroidia bacterium]